MFKRAKDRIQSLLAEYGIVAVLVWGATWTTAFAAFTWSSQCAYAATGSDVGLLQAAGTAYPAFVATYPLRVAMTVALTPPLALLVRRRRAV